MALAFALAAGLAYLPYRLLDGSRMGSTAHLDRELARSRAKIEALRAENEKYRREIDALKNDPGAIEDIARSELGMVRPGDVVIRVERVAEESEATP